MQGEFTAGEDKLLKISQTDERDCLIGIASSSEHLEKSRFSKPSTVKVLHFRVSKVCLVSLHVSSSNIGLFIDAILSPEAPLHRKCLHVPLMSIDRNLKGILKFLKSYLPYRISFGEGHSCELHQPYH